MRVIFADKIYEVLYTKEIAGQTLYAVEDEPNHVDWLVNPEVVFEQQQEPTSDHWQDVRERAAIAAMQGLIFSKFDYFSEIKISEEAIKYADELVRKLKGE